MCAKHQARFSSSTFLQGNVPALAFAEYFPYLCIIMEKGKLYRSRWDVSTGALLLLITGCIVLLCFEDDGFWPVIVCIGVLLLTLATLSGIYYRVGEQTLTVYCFYCPKRYDIMSITGIAPTVSREFAPAASLTERIAITLRGKEKPLIISPVHRQQFIRQLLEVNPGITLK